MFLIHLPALVASAQETLKSASPFPVGVGIQDRVFENTGDWPLLTAQFSLVTPENCMKPVAVQPEPGHWSFETADRFVEFALAKELKIVGHCLVWAKDDRTPPWFGLEEGRPVSKDVLLARMKTHIDTVMGRYREKSPCGMLSTRPWMMVTGRSVTLSGAAPAGRSFW